MKNSINLLKPKLKKLSSKTWKAKAWKIFSLYIRTKDADGEWNTCYTCQRLDLIKNLDAGHWLQGRHNSVMFDERNVHPQCTACNRFRHGNLIEYTLRMQVEYGKAVCEELRALNNESKPMKATDYKEIYEKYKQKVELLQRNPIEIVDLKFNEALEDYRNTKGKMIYENNT